ncbi:hypothetical protein ABTF88_19185, partial [Acinetobacter baumannii]
SGNVASEDLAYMLGSRGIDTGVDIGALLRLRQRVAAWLAGETLHGTLWRAGLPKTVPGVGACDDADRAAPSRCGTAASPTFPA